MRRPTPRLLLAALTLGGMLATVGAAPAAAAIHTQSVKTVTRTVFVPVDGTAELKAFCPKGYRATAGGGWWDGIDQSGAADFMFRYLGASLPIQGGKGWYVNGWNNDLTKGAVLNLRMTCLKAAVLGKVTVKTTWLPNPSGQVSGTADCGAGKRVVAGGAAWQVQGDPLDAAVAKSNQLGSSGPLLNTRAWFGSGTRNNPSSTASLRVVALCRPASWVGSYTVRKQPLEVQGIAPALPVYVASGTVSCRSGQRIVTAGVYWQNPFDNGGTPVGDGTLSNSAPVGKFTWTAAGTAGDIVDRNLLLVAFCRPI